MHFLDDNKSEMPFGLMLDTVQWTVQAPRKKGKNKIQKMVSSHLVVNVSQHGKDKASFFSMNISMS